MALTDAKIRAAKATDGKNKKLYDAKGLFLLVTPAGGKLWRLKYRFEGKEKLMAIGKYPDTPLASKGKVKGAREKRDEARQLLASGLDPIEVKKQEAAEKKQAEKNSFEIVAREWHKKNYKDWNKKYADQLLRRLEKDIFPEIGSKPIGDIKPQEVLNALRVIEKRGAVETAHRIKQSMGAIFRYAVATGRADRDPTPDLRGALSKKKVKHHAAILEPEKLGALLRAIDSYDGTYVVKHALKLAPLVFVLPGELHRMEWSEVDLENSQWNIPAEKMKMKEPHIVPLSKQAVSILREVEKLTGKYQYVFPSHRSAKRPMSDGALSAALSRMDFKSDIVTPHGFRATARTMIGEGIPELDGSGKPVKGEDGEIKRIIFPVEYIEQQLAHIVKDPLGRAYNRTQHLEGRRKMMQVWADYLDRLQ